LQTLVEGNQESIYAWGLETATNNQAEAYTFFQGISITINLGIRELVVIRDSRIVIKYLTHKEPPKDFQLALILSRITKLTQKLIKISFFHVL
jgi:ribonuclease HI